MGKGFWVLLEHEMTDETMLVLVPAKSARDAEVWGQDCDRGLWEFRAVVEYMPKFLPLAMFEARELERDPVWYRKTEEGTRGRHSSS